jgi:hypothetical protein
MIQPFLTVRIDKALCTESQTAHNYAFRIECDPAAARQSFAGRNKSLSIRILNNTEQPSS